jgi:predicted  nucleic acid-binding Zn-ribbon protein
MIRTNGEDANLRQQLAPVIDAKRKLADLDNQLGDAQKQIDEITNDQKRLRDNLAALKGSAEERALTRRYTEELNQQEDRIAALHKDQETIRANRAAAELHLSEAIEALQIDEKLG